MRIVADHKIAHVETAFAGLGDTVLLPGHEIRSETVTDAEILLVRSITRVDEKLLRGSKVRFVGTATIGVDHIDVAYLQSNGIALASAPGCNAHAVAEYVLAGLLYLSRTHGFALKGKSVGVVGVGNVGSKVVRMAKVLGMEVLPNDPPLARVTGNPDYLALEALHDADVITLHVPLIRSGRDATFHLFDGRQIARLKSGCILLNTSRGSVVETDALKDALSAGHLKACVLDVWENEPHIDTDLLNLVNLATPHIAGYSLEGKVTATRMIYQAVCRFLDKHCEWRPEDGLSPRSANEIVIADAGDNLEATLAEVVDTCYPIVEDDRKLRAIAGLPAEERGGYFEQLRSGYPLRREFNHTTVAIHDNKPELKNLLKQLRFEVQTDSVEFERKE